MNRETKTKPAAKVIANNFTSLARLLGCGGTAGGTDGTAGFGALPKLRGLAAIGARNNCMANS